MVLQGSADIGVPHIGTLSEFVFLFAPVEVHDRFLSVQAVFTLSEKMVFHKVLGIRFAELVGDHLVEGGDRGEPGDDVDVAEKADTELGQFLALAVNALAVVVGALAGIQDTFLDFLQVSQELNKIFVEALERRILLQVSQGFLGHSRELLLVGLKCCHILFLLFSNNLPSVLRRRSGRDDSTWQCLR